MTTFHLVRHGDTRYDLAEERRLRGGARDLVPLSAAGVRQIEETATVLRALAPELIVSSPMTRALQSAAILCRRLDLPLAVELDLHEWVPDLSSAYDSVAFVRQAQAELEGCGGEWPAGNGAAGSRIRASGVVPGQLSPAIPTWRTWRSSATAW